MRSGLMLLLHRPQTSYRFITHTMSDTLSTADRV